MRDKYIVCGPKGPLVAGKLALCSECGAEVYPTEGTLAHARKEDISLLCMDCFAKTDGYEYGGVIDNGKIVSSRHGEMLRELMEEWKKSQGKG
jgi:hypothetical protein